MKKETGYKSLFETVHFTIEHLSLYG